MKDDLLLATPHPLFPNIFGDYVIVDFPYENIVLGASTSDHSQNTPDVSPSLHSREDASVFANPFSISSVFFENVDGEHFCFSSTPLYDSSDHEDTDEHIEFSDHGCCDLFSPSFDYNDDSFIVNISKPHVFDDLPIDEVETPQAFEALQPKMMVMLGPHFLEVNFTPNQKSVGTPKAPHHSPLYIEDQSS